MSVYQVSGDTLILANDGNVQSGNVLLANSWNPITGSAGPVEVKITNTSAANIAEVTWIREDTTYEYSNVAWTTSGNGTDAVFDVSVTDTAYVVTVINTGNSFLTMDTVTVLGTDVGGLSPANDLTITVDTVTAGGHIDTFTVSGTQVWPQTGIQTIYIAPTSTDFIQVNSVAADTLFTSDCGDGNILITPVNVL